MRQLPPHSATFFPPPDAWPVFASEEGLGRWRCSQAAARLNVLPLSWWSLGDRMFSWLVSCWLWVGTCAAEVSSWYVSRLRFSRSLLPLSVALGRLSAARRTLASRASARTGVLVVDSTTPFTCSTLVVEVRVLHDVKRTRSGCGSTRSTVCARRGRGRQPTAARGGVPATSGHRAPPAKTRGKNATRRKNVPSSSSASASASSLSSASSCGRLCKKARALCTAYFRWLPCCERASAWPRP